jgi:DNA (cytosine-5)-methyltransferase 3A
LIIWQFRRTSLRVHADQEKTCTLTANMGTWGNNVPIIMDQTTPEEYFWRKLTTIECEKLQTLPDNYTNHVSATRRYKAIGNGWTVDVISHILSFCNF